MNPEEFAAKRREQFVRVDAELMPATERALRDYGRGQAEWDAELIDDASVIWLETFLDESPNADPDRFLPAFRESIGESLAKTEQPGSIVEQSQVERVARWLGTYTVNHATWAAAGARGMRQKRWTTMHDGDVREAHVVADGQIQPIGAPFNVGGHDLRFPGDPVGPPEIWINCRCVIQAAARRGELNVTPTTFAIVEEEVDEELPFDEPEDDEELITEVPVHGVLAPEGVWTGDGRRFAEGSLSSRNLPLPIAYQLLSGDGHAGSATVGRIDEVFREGNEYRFRGALMLNREHTASVIDGILDGTVRGISVDVDDVEVGEMSDDDRDAGRVTFSAARVAGVTIVPIPAFQEAFLALGHEFLADLPAEAKEILASGCGCAEGPEDDNPDIELGYDAMTAGAFAPGTKDGPGWITHPVPTSRIRRYWVRGKGAAKIKWGVPGDFNRCRRQLAKYVQNPEWLAGLCANMHKEAIGVWPGRPLSAVTASAGTPAPIFTLVAAATYTFDSNLFARPQMETPRVGVVVEDDHVYGYIAQWGVCHIGISGVCTEAPASSTDYWYYATGVVDTDQGPVHVGQITMDTGHASLRANAKIAAAHYDNTGSAVADIAVGEDAYGIWFSGVMRKSATEEQRHALRASGRLSGDWRQIGRDLELVAALAVNVPGFPIPHVRAGVYNGEQVSLVAAGLEVTESALAPDVYKVSAEDMAGIARVAVSEYRSQEKREAKAAPLREALRQKQIAALRAKIKEQ